MACFPTPPLFDAPLRGTPRISGLKLTSPKLEGWGYRAVKMS